jgi:hypothetical protein
MRRINRRIQHTGREVVLAILHSAGERRVAAGRPARLLDEVVEGPARCRACFLNVVSGGEAYREEGGRDQPEGGVMLLGPLHQRALVVSGVN